MAVLARTYRGIGLTNLGSVYGKPEVNWRNQAITLTDPSTSPGRHRGRCGEYQDTVCIPSAESTLGNGMDGNTEVCELLWPQANDSFHTRFAPISTIGAFFFWRMLALFCQRLERRVTDI